MKLSAVASIVLVAVMMATAVSAVDIRGFTSSTGCSGTILEEPFLSHPDGACAPFNIAKAGSVLFTGLTRCKEGLVYNVDCADIVARRRGATSTPSSVCFTGGGFTAAKWQTVTGCVE